MEDVKCNDKSKAILLAEVLECSNVSSHHIAAKELRRLEQENKKLLEICQMIMDSSFSDEVTASRLNKQIYFSAKEAVENKEKTN